MSDPLRVNLGCGEFPMDGWVNVDKYVSAEGVIKADLRDLNWEHEVHEVNMSHVLEHLPWTATIPVFQQIHGWLVPNGKLTVEVPDMVVIMAMGTRQPDWYTFVYGSQQHEGEIHMAGFTSQMLLSLLDGCGYHDVTVTAFRSEHPVRRNFPCIEAVAFA